MSSFNYLDLEETKSNLYSSNRFLSPSKITDGSKIDSLKADIKQIFEFYQGVHRQLQARRVPGALFDSQTLFQLVLEDLKNVPDLAYYFENVKEPSSTTLREEQEDSND